MKNVAEILKLSPRTIDQLIYRFRWRDRAAAWQAHREQQRAQAMEAAGKRMAERQVQLADALYDLAMDGARGLAGQDLSVGELVKLADAFAKLSRTAFGPDKHIAITGRDGHPPAFHTHVPGTQPEREAEMRQALAQLAASVGAPQGDVMFAATGTPDPYQVLLGLP